MRGDLIESETVGERYPAGEQEIKRAAKAIQVAAGIRLCGRLCLLRRQVIQRAQHRPVRRQRTVRTQYLRWSMAR